MLAPVLILIILPVVIDVFSRRTTREESENKSLRPAE
jgi:hypothetical protein